MDTLTVEDFNKFLGANIAAFRGLNLMSQDDLAKKITTSSPTLSDWENGKTKVSAYTIYLIALALKQPIEVFYDFSKFSDHEPKVENE